MKVDEMLKIDPNSKACHTSGKVMMLDRLKLKIQKTIQIDPNPRNS